MSDPAPHLKWAKGGHAEITRIEGDALELRSTTSAPPGARLEAVLVNEPAKRVKIKSHGTHKEDDGTYTLRGRLIDATRELRESFLALSTAERG